MGKDECVWVERGGCVREDEGVYGWRGEDV